MSRPDLFLDSSALFAGVISASGASRALLLLAEVGQVTITISEQVVVETERAIARKAPHLLADYRGTWRATRLRITSSPSVEEIAARRYVIGHPANVPIVVAAMKIRADFLVTLNRRHFLDDPQVAERAGLRIGTPGDALAWVREQLRA